MGAAASCLCGIWHTPVAVGSSPSAPSSRVTQHTTQEWGATTPFYSVDPEAQMAPPTCPGPLCHKLEWAGPEPTSGEGTPPALGTHVPLTSNRLKIYEVACERQTEKLHN